MKPRWLVDLVLPAINGGNMQIAQLDKIRTKPEAAALVVSGLGQETFESLVAQYGTQFKGIYFWKCPRIVDLTPLEQLSEIEYLGFYWNHKATRLWDFSRTPRLRGLLLHDFKRLSDLSDLALAASLEELELGDAYEDAWAVTSLEPIGSLVHLKSLNLTAKRVDDGRIEPLGRLSELESLHFPSNMFTTEQVAWLRAHLPETLQSKSLEPFWRFENASKDDDGLRKDILVVGKRKPWLSSSRDADRIERYRDSFADMVDDFRSNPTKAPAGPA